MSSEAAMLVRTPPVINKLDRIRRQSTMPRRSAYGGRHGLRAVDRKLVPHHPRAFSESVFMPFLSVQGQAGFQAPRRMSVERRRSESLTRGSESSFWKRIRFSMRSLSDRTACRSTTCSGPSRSDGGGFGRPGRSAYVAASGPSCRRRSRVEATIVSKDGRVLGRADLLDATNDTVTTRPGLVATPAASSAKAKSGSFGCARILRARTASASGAV
jgi:hypothetical protein